MAQYSTTDDTQWNDVLRAKGILTTPQPNDDASSLDRMPTIRGGKSNSSTNITQAEIEALVDAVIAERVAREDEEMPELTDEQLDAMLEADTGASLEDERALDAYR